jgi:hypothetical protein
MEIGCVEILAIGCVQKGRAPMAGIVAFAGPLDLNHFGTEIGEQLPAPWPGKDAGQLDHLDSRQRLHGLAMV